jgi:oxalate decarboxylase
MTILNRRNVMLGGAASAAALGLGAAVVPPAIPGTNTMGPVAALDPGPENPAPPGPLPASRDLPAVDLPLFWASFNLAHRRYQSGGWAREITQHSFAISEDIAGINMRLGPNCVRAMHWRAQAEWGMVTAGVCRITTLDEMGHPQIADVKKGDLWYFPAGLPHSLRGLSPEGAELVIALDHGKASEFDSLMASDWMANLWIHQGEDPGPREAMQPASSHPYVFELNELAPLRQTRGGTVKIADSRNFAAAKTIAAALVTVKPGAVRELHWHPNADKWQHWIQGEGRMTVFKPGANAATTDFEAGDIGYVKRGFGHYYQNTGTSDLLVLELFKSAQYAELALSRWLAHLPPRLIQEQLNFAPDVLAAFAKNRANVMSV